MFDTEVASALAGWRRSFTRHHVTLPVPLEKFPLVRSRAFAMARESSTDYDA